MWTLAQDLKLLKLHYDDDAPMSYVATVLAKSKDECNTRLGFLMEQRRRNSQSLYLLSVSRDVTLSLLCEKSKVDYLFQKPMPPNRGACMLMGPSVLEEIDQKFIRISASEQFQDHSPVEYTSKFCFRACLNDSGNSNSIKMIVHESQILSCLDPKLIFDISRETQAEFSITEVGSKEVLVDISGPIESVTKAFLSVVLCLRRHCFELSRHEITDARKVIGSSPYFLFVGGLAYELSEDDLFSIAAEYGKIVALNIIRDKETGDSKGFAFLEYGDEKSISQAVARMNGAQVKGLTIRVDLCEKLRILGGRAELR